MNENKEPKPPFYTASIGLFLQTILIFGGISVFYFVYIADMSTPVIKKSEQKITKVSVNDNLLDIVKKMKNNTTLEFAPGKYQQKLVIENLQGIILKASKNDDGSPVILESLDGIPVTWQNCQDGEMHNIYIISHTQQNPALNVSTCKNITFYNVRLQSPDIALKCQLDSANITLKGVLHNESRTPTTTIVGQILVQKCQGFSLQDYVWSATAATYAGILEDSNQIRITGTYLKAVQGLLLRRILFLQQPSIIAKNKILAQRDGLLLSDNSSHVTLEGNEIKVKQGPSLAVSKSSHITIGKEQSRQILESEVSNAVLLVNVSESSMSSCWLKNKDTREPCLSIVTACEGIALHQNKISGLHYAENNIATESHGGGVFIQGSTKILLNKNEISHSENYGIRIESRSQVQLSGNSIQENITNGVEIEESEVSMLQNQVYQNGSIGVFVKNTTGTFEDNQIRDNDGIGILLEASNISLKENKINSNGGHGIALQKSSMPSMQRNQIIGNKGLGISFGKQAQKPEWRDNIFQNNRDGICDDPSAKSQEPVSKGDSAQKEDNVPEKASPTPIVSKIEPISSAQPSQEEIDKSWPDVWKTLEMLEQDKKKNN